MDVLKERYLVNERGERVAVVLSLDEYSELLEELEELREREEMRHYDPAHDPDAGLTVKEDLLDDLLKQEADYKAGRIKGKTWEQVKRELGLDKDV